MSNKNKPYIKANEDEILYFVMGKVTPKLRLGRIKKIGTLDITSRLIGIGELLFNEFTTKKGLYNIYTYNDCLFAVHESESIREQKFRVTNYYAYCDIAMFSFNDAASIRKYTETKGKKSFGTVFPDFNHNILFDANKKAYDYVFIYEDELDVNRRIKNKFDDTEPIAVFSGNGQGDGSFPIYKGTNAFAILNSWTIDRMLDLV